MALGTRAAEVARASPAGLRCWFGAAVCVQMQAVELIDELLTAEQVVLGLPGVLFASVALPPDQVLPLPLLVLALVHYSLHLQKREGLD